MAPQTFNIETVFKEYKNKIYRLALGITRNELDAEDAIQNTFLKIINNLQNFRSESRLSTWIYRIAYNEALMVLRKRRSVLRLTGSLNRLSEDKSSRLFINWSKLPDEQLLDDEFKERVDTAIRRMPIKYRMPLLLDNIEGLSLKESAKVLGLKINSLKTRLHRAHLIVKSEMADYFKDREIQGMKEKRICNTLTGFVYDYAGGYLPKRKTSAFKRHISDCLNCKLFLNNYVKALSITKALECQDLPLELQDKIKAFLFNRK